MTLLIRNGTVLTMNDARDVVTGDVWIRDGRIESVGVTTPGRRADTEIDAGGALVLPGFVQTHIHLCQTLFRGFADDLPLLAWLRTRVWPLEAAHDEVTLRAAARLAAAELLLGGTTTVLTMETVHGTDAVFDALVPTGLRAVVGKCLMNTTGETPARLYQTTRDALDEALALHARWTGAANGRLRAALRRASRSPARAICSRRPRLSRVRMACSSTHASEQRAEIDVVRELTGMDNLAYLDAVVSRASACARRIASGPRMPNRRSRRTNTSR
jgi:cytosine/adenosine deaminase-related metal-dependent hydrolase